METAPQLGSWTQLRVPCAGFWTPTSQPPTPRPISQAEREKQDKSGGAPSAKAKASPGISLTKSRGSPSVAGPERKARSQAAPESQERWAALQVSLTLKLEDHWPREHPHPQGQSP